MLVLKFTDGTHWVICVLVVYFHCHRCWEFSGSDLRLGDKECNDFPQMQMSSIVTLDVSPRIFFLHLRSSDTLFPAIPSEK